MIAKIYIGLVRKGLEDYGEVRGIREIVADHGTQFFATSWIKTVNLQVHLTFSWLKMESLIFLSGVRHPQTKWENPELVSYL